ncbi:MAG TPA: polyphosphate kinase 1 [Gemmatimonadales bacterium]
MSSRPAPEVKWDVASGERLQELIAAPLPLGLRSAAPRQSHHRDLYYDTPDGSLGRRDITCRFRIGADDHRELRLSFPDQPPQAGRAPGRLCYAAEVTELDLGASLLGTSEPARRLRGLVDPVALQVIAELEVDRTIRAAGGGWPWRSRFDLVYDAVTLRHGSLHRGFQEMKARQLRRGSPSLDALSTALTATPGLRPILETRVARAQRLAAGLEAEALTRSIRSGGAVTVLALAAGSIAFVPDGDTLRLPIAEGQGEAACRHLLQATFGSAVGDLALLGGVAGRNGGRPQEVWVARRLRLDAELPPTLVWLGADEVLRRVGRPELRDPDTLAALDLATRSDLLREAATTATTPRERPSAPVVRPAPDSALLLSADLSLLEFQERVLGLAEDPETPLLERLNFLAIVSANLDEFYMVNVGALRQQDGEALEDGTLEAIGLRVRSLSRRQQHTLGLCLDRLGALGVHLRRWDELSAEAQEELGAQFRREIFPLLTPRAITVSPGFPVAVMPQLSLLLAVLLHDPDTGPTHVAYLRLPDRLPRFLTVPGTSDRIAIEEVVRANLEPLYPRRAIQGAWVFRLTRAADLELEEEDAGNLLQAIEESVRRRALNPVVRLEIEREMPPVVRERLLWELRFERSGEAAALGRRELMEVEGLLDLRALRELAALPLSAERYPAFEGRDPWGGEPVLWDLLRRRDVLVHHPFDAFAATTARFFADAAGDPAVLAIRITLYRVGERSPIVDALLRALQQGKEVAIFVELKARFDEERNVGWVRRLEEAGATVVYGVVGLKNHAKVGLVLRRESDGLRRYVHIGTGNYNAGTARVYTDLALFSADPELGADIHDLFNQLLGSSRPPGGAFRRIAVAPETLLPWLLGAIERETAHARAGRPARIRAKLNGLADPEVVEALYVASRAGVSIELVVRGLCILRPGVPGHSERIRVVSRLGRFLEHARVYHFANGGADEYFIGSADWRPRNLRRRIEVVAPVTDPAARDRLCRLLETELADPAAWELQPDGSYRRGSDPP